MDPLLHKHDCFKIVKINTCNCLASILRTVENYNYIFALPNHNVHNTVMGLQHKLSTERFFILAITFFCII